LPLGVGKGELTLRGWKSDVHHRRVERQHQLYEGDEPQGGPTLRVCVARSGVRALSASEFMRTIQSGSRTSTLVRAIAELGRIAKTLFLLAYVDDEAYRRRILVQLNRGEGRHRLARAVFHGQRGELRQRYREGQEDQLGALGLVVNAVVLWNTRYIERALKQLEQIGLAVRPEDVERIWPLGFQHINMLGRYSFDLPEQLTRGELRSLRDPSEATDQEVLVA